MAASGIPAIDNLLGGTGTPIAAGSTDKPAVGAIQDLLRGHGYSRMPGIRDASRGTFGKGTKRAVAAFRKKNGLPNGGAVDQDVLSQLVQVPASDPIVSQAYVTLVLNLAFDSMTGLVSLVAQVEGAGKFTAFNPNTDSAGLSIGIIQWAQSKLRLNELLVAFNTDAADPTNKPNQAAARAAFGGQANLDGVITETADTNGGVDGDGNPKHPDTFNLVEDPWKARFLRACRDTTLQVVQVQTAVADFQKSAAKITAKMPLITTQRQVAFTLDVANQFGDKGAKSVYDAAVGTLDDPTVATGLLEAMRDETVKRLRKKFPKKPKIAEGGADRRNFFINTDLLKDTPV